MTNDQMTKPLIMTNSYDMDKTLTGITKCTLMLVSFAFRRMSYGAYVVLHMTPEKTINKLTDVNLTKNFLSNLVLIISPGFTDI